MPEIKILESTLVDQIAAGEVIERPSSVLKELLENSIDAAATQINIQIIKGGHELIQISDNGCGMNKNDLRLSFQRHATSKIRTMEDLNTVRSLGFRGEALPSIASVSQVSAKSSLNGSDGYEIKIFGSEKKSFEPTSSLKGTSIRVGNLFFNTPARRKFLKKPETEQAAINVVVRRFMLSYPAIGFQLINNQKTVYDVKSSTLKGRIGDIYGSAVKNSILAVEIEKSPFKVSGFIGNLSLVKKRLGEQYLFLNGRYIKDRLLNSSVFSSYRTLIQRGEFPFFVLFIETPLNSVDVNVHPAKLEVRFENEWKVYHVIKSAITFALQDILKVIPDFNPQSNSNYGFQPESVNLRFPKSSTLDILPLERAPRNIEVDSSEINYDLNAENIDKAKDRIQEINNDRIREKLSISKTDFIWQIHSKYLITEIKSGLVIIDQHVAHERVLYEEAITAMEGNGFLSQVVLFPQTIQFQPEEYERLIEITHYLERIGFKIREFGENTIIIEGIPPDVEWGNEIKIIKEILDQYLNSKDLSSSFIDQIAAIYACKSAIKAGDALKPEERIHLINRLFATEHPYYCPHGRPIIVNLSIDELDQRFERI